MIYLPTLHTFAMNNVFTGSAGALRFKLTLAAAVIGKLPGHSVDGGAYGFKLVAAFFFDCHAFALLGNSADLLTYIADIL